MSWNKSIYLAMFLWLILWKHDMHTAEYTYFLDVHVCHWTFHACLYLRMGYLGKVKAQGQRRNTKYFRGLARESQGNLLAWGYLLFWPEKAHITKPTCTLQGCSAAQLCLMGLPAYITRSRAAWQGFIWVHVVGVFLGCKTKPLKKSHQWQWKYRKSPMIS